jgi:hypothetical protein
MTTEASKQAALECAQRNGGVLTRTRDGNWKGLQTERQHTAESVWDLVKAGKMVYTSEAQGRKYFNEAKVV